MGQYTALPIDNRTFTDYSKWVFLTDFGVVGDGATDDTVALNAAFASPAGAGVTIVWNVGFCNVTDTIIVGSASIGQNFTNIYCPNGPLRSGIRWTGASSGVAMKFSRQKFVSCYGLGIFNVLGARGTTTGLGIGGPGGGNQSSGISFYDLFVDGFSTGVQAGIDGGAASELAFYKHIFQNCDIGFTAIDFNSLDFTFVNGGMSECAIGIQNSASSGFAVFGGSASNSTTCDFQIGANSQQTYIGGGFRSETAAACVLGVGGGGSCTVERILCVNPLAPFNSISGAFSSLVVRGCWLEGFIDVSASGGLLSSIEVSGCNLTRWDTTRKLPAILPTVNFENTMRCKADFHGNNDRGAFPARNIMEHQGMMGGRYDGSVTTSPFYEPCVTIIPIDQSTTADFGTNYMALSHVRHLGEGTIPGATAATAPATGKNLRVQTTFGGASATSAILFARTTVVVTAAGAPLITATTGTFNAADVGKKLKITNGADTGADWYGYITEVLSTVTANVFPSTDSTPGGRYPQCVTKATVIGEDEPDNNYMILSLSGSANETFSWESKSATGFTVRSSNATSTAIVNALIVR